MPNPFDQFDADSGVAVAREANPFDAFDTDVTPVARNVSVPFATNKLPDLQATTRGGSKVALPDGPVANPFDELDLGVFQTAIGLASLTGRAMGRGGKLLEAVAGDIASIPSSVAGYTKFGENIRAFSNEPWGGVMDENVPGRELESLLPIEERANQSGKVGRFVMKAGLMPFRMEPQLAAGFGLGAIGAPSAIAAGLPMLVTERGEIDPIGAAIAAALPLASRVGEKTVAAALAKIPISQVVISVLGQEPLKLKGKIVQKLGGVEISSDQFRKFLEGGGGFVAANTYLLATQAPQLASLPAEQRNEAVLDAVAQNLAPSLLGFIRPGMSKTLEQLGPEIYENPDFLKTIAAASRPPASTQGGKNATEAKQIEGRVPVQSPRVEPKRKADAPAKPGDSVADPAGQPPQGTAARPVVAPESPIAQQRDALQAIQDAGMSTPEQDAALKALNDLEAANKAKQKKIADDFKTQVQAGETAKPPAAKPAPLVGEQTPPVAPVVKPEPQRRGGQNSIESMERGRPVQIDSPEAVAELSLEERKAINPDGTVTIHRAVVKGATLQPGDFVVLDKQHAETYAKQGSGLEIITQRVPAKDVAYVFDAKGPWPIRYAPGGALSMRQAEAKKKAEAAKPATTPPTVTPPQGASLRKKKGKVEKPAVEKSVWKSIGKNSEGNEVFEDQRGVRSIVEGNVRITEPVSIIPTRTGIETGTRDRTGTRFDISKPEPTTWEEIGTNKNGETILQSGTTRGVMRDGKPFWEPKAGPDSVTVEKWFETKPALPETKPTEPEGPFTVEWGTRAMGSKSEQVDTIEEARRLSKQKIKTSDFVTVYDKDNNEIDVEDETRPAKPETKPAEGGKKAAKVFPKEAELAKTRTEHEAVRTALMNKKKKKVAPQAPPATGSTSAESKSRLVAKPISQAEAESAVASVLGSVPPNVMFVNDPDAPAGRVLMTYGELPRITLNLAKLESVEEATDVLREELVHNVWDAPEVADARKAIEALVSDVDRQRQGEQGYNPDETQEEAANERTRRIFADAEKANIFVRAWRAIVEVFKKLFGLKLNEAQSARVAAKAIMREAVKNKPSTRLAEMGAEPIASEDLGEPKVTQVSGKKVGIAGKEKMPESERQITEAEKWFTEHGLPIQRVDQRDMRLPGNPLKTQFRFKPDGFNYDVEATKLAEDLEKELAKNDQAENLLLSNLTTSLANSIADGDASVTGRDGRQMISDALQQRLFNLAQTPASQAGQLLALRGQHSFDPEGVLNIARNVGVHLQNVWSQNYGGELVRKIMDRIASNFAEPFTGEEIERIYNDNPKFRELFDRTVARLKPLPSLKQIIAEIFSTPISKQSDLEARFVDVLVNKFKATPEEAERLRQEFTVSFAKSFERAREAAIQKSFEQLSPEERAAATAEGKTLWQKIEQAVRAGLFDEGSVLERLAASRGYKIPTEEQKAQMRQWAEEEERLRTPSQRQIDKYGGNVERATVDAEQGTQDERVALIKKMQANWSRWRMPLNLDQWLRNKNVAQNNAKAVNEFVAANLLLKLGFAARQWIDVGFTSMPLNAVNRSLVQVLARAEGDGGFSAETIKDLDAAIREMTVARIGSVKATLREMERVARGKSNRKVIDRMTHSIGIFDRMHARADEFEAQGNKAAARAIRLGTILRAGYRVAEVWDAVQSVGLEWQEMRQQLSTDLRAAGKNRAEIATQLDDLFGGIHVDMREAMEEARLIGAEKGLTKDKATLEHDAWRLVKSKAYDKMRELAGTRTDYKAQNEQLLELHSWNLPEVGGVGGFIAETIKTLKTKTEQAGVPTGGLFSFGNAMGIAANRMMTFSGLGVFGGWGFGESPWYEGPSNKRQRRIEGIEGMVAIALLIALAAAGKILVQIKYPEDKDEKEKFIAAGHKLNTVRFQNDDGTWFELPIRMSPLSYVASPIYMIGGVQQLLQNRERQQDRLNKEAARLGLTPGKAKSISTGDAMGVLAQGLYGMFTGGRTASGAVQSFSDYGNFNLNRAASGFVSPYLPGLPAWQEAARMLGATVDTRTATLRDVMVPSPWSGHQRVNSLGDPLTNPNATMRVIQVLTGGFGAGDDKAAASNHAYQQIFEAGYAIPDINHNKGYNFDGTIRPMTPDELEKYVVARGSAFKDELSGVNVAGMSENEAKKTVQAAYRKANQRALSELGVSQPALGAQTPASASAASGAGAYSASRPRSRSYGSLRLGRVRRPRLGRVRGASLRLRRGPSLRIGRRLKLPRAKGSLRVKKMVRGLGSLA